MLNFKVNVKDIPMFWCRANIAAAVIENKLKQINMYQAGMNVDLHCLCLMRFTQKKKRKNKLMLQKKTNNKEQVWGLPEQYLHQEE